MTDISLHQPMDSDDITLLDMLKIIHKHRRLLWQVPAVTVLLGLVYALVATPIFRAKTVIMPPQQQQSSAAAMLSQLGGLAGAAGGLAGLKSPNDLYVAMLKSRSIEERLVKRFNLQTLYKTRLSSEAIEELEDASKIYAGKDGLIEIAVEDKSPKLAADMANAYVEELRNLSKRLAVTEAQQRRLYFEEQLKHTRDQLAEAENNLREVQQKTGMLDLKGDGQAIIEGTAKLRAQIAAKQIEISSMRQYAADQSPRMQRAQAELTALQSHLNDFAKGDADDVMLSRNKLTSAGLEYARSFRNVKYNEMLYEMLAKQWELAKLDEAKEGASIQVLDVATVPEQKSRPRRGMTLAISLAIGLIAAVLIIFGKEASSHLRRNMAH